jgi:hypothetical protein
MRTGGDCTMTPNAQMGTPSAAALRMQRSRQRRRQGGVMVNLEVGPGVIADLVALGWLPAADRGDKEALTLALNFLIERAIGARVAPPTGSHDQLGFMCTLKPATIETLVTFGWLPADQGDDLGSIIRAFRRFAGRALDVARNSGPDRWYIA